ncbi:MAG TPA: hypothetical protein VMV05_07835, partial [bacterium]|nr:hypothetical protein [bacterium]
TNTPTPTETSTSSNTSTITDTHTPTDTATNSATPTATDTPTVTYTSTITPTEASGCLQTVRVYDERGEEMASICGNLSLGGTGTYTMSLSTFSPNSNGSGGSIGIYLNGQLVATWNATDEKGNVVPNGFYHFVLAEMGTNTGNSTFERDAFIDPNHPDSVTFTAMPNHAGPGETITFAAFFDGVPADGRSKIKMYNTAGELLAVINLTGMGTAPWNLTNGLGQPVASGIYFAVLSGINPSNGGTTYKITKVLVTH